MPFSLVATTTLTFKMPSPLDSIDRLVWDNALTELGRQIGQTEVERWFADTNLSSLRDRTANLVVPSRLHAKWIRANHLGVLCAVLGVNDCVLAIKEPVEFPIADGPPPRPGLAATDKNASAAGNGATKYKFSAPVEAPERLVLNRDYSFENFVVGGANRLAHASALGVADGQARGFNPLFLHGSVGLGKTHLLQSIAHHCLNKNPDCKIIFLSCEQFVNHFIQALQQGYINAFRNRYRSADILVVDDVQLLSNKQRTQEEFFHTFNELHNAHKQIVLASDSPPEEIKDLQVAYLKACVANQDVVQDHAFFATLYHFAVKNKISYIISGGNIATESVFPQAWHHSAMDAINLKSIHKKYGTIPLKKYKTISFFKYYFYYPFVKGMKTIRPLNYLPYNRREAIEALKKEVDYEEYGKKHSESRFTKFFQNYYLPKKFGYDKRKPHLSSQILSGEISRNEAIMELKTPVYRENELRESLEYIGKKLEFKYEELKS